MAVAWIWASVPGLGKQQAGVLRQVRILGGYSMFNEPYRADHMTERQQRQRRTLIIGASVTGVSLLGMLIAALLVWNWAFHDLPAAPGSAAE